MATSKTVALKDLSADTFKPHIGSSFKAIVFAGAADPADENTMDSPGIEVDLELVACEEAKSAPEFDLPDCKDAVKRTPFCITFRGEDHMPYPEGAYDISHPEIGEIKGLSMSRDTCEKGIKGLLSANFG